MVQAAAAAQRRSKSKSKRYGGVLKRGQKGAQTRKDEMDEAFGGLPGRDARVAESEGMGKYEASLRRGGLGEYKRRDHSRSKKRSRSRSHSKKKRSRSKSKRKSKSRGRKSRSKR